MKTKKWIVAIGLISMLFGCSQKAKTVKKENVAERKLFMDVHNLDGPVTLAAVADAHRKDLAAQGEFDVSFLKYWVDEKAGKIYCLAEATSENNMFKTHEKAHGLMPDSIMEVAGGKEAALHGKALFLDIHHMGPGNVTAEAVAGAHAKDLAVQGKYGVNFVNYWVDVKKGEIVCLSEAPDSLAIIHTHSEAHGLLPAKIERVEQGN